MMRLRFRLRYGLRSLFVFIAVVALVCAWVARQLDIIAVRSQLVRDLKAVDCLVTETTDGMMEPEYPILGVSVQVPWYRIWLGDKQYRTVVASKWLLIQLKEQIQRVLPEARTREWRYESIWDRSGKRKEGKAVPIDDLQLP